MWFCRAVGSLTQQSWISHLLCCFIMDHEMDVCCCIGPILKTFFVILVSFSINHVTFFGTLTISRIVQLYAWNRNGGRRPPQASGPTIPPPPGSPTKPFTIKYFSSEWFELCWRKRSHAFYPADINIWSFCTLWTSWISNNGWRWTYTALQDFFVPGCAICRRFLGTTFRKSI